MAHDPFHDLTLTGGPLDRQGLRREDQTFVDGLLDDPATRVLVLRGEQTTLRPGPEGGATSLALRAPEPADRGRLWVYLGRLDGRDHLVVDEGVDEPPTDTDREATLELSIAHGSSPDDAPHWSGLRDVALRLSAAEAGLLATALALVHWHRAHGFCPRCGVPTVVATAGWTRRCPSDGSDHYPRTDPAVIMAVTDADDRLLLARNVAWPPGRFSILAGFVEPGETMAAAVAREVREEVGVEVDDVRFVADQPWPFPSSLMLGFTARARTTGLTLDDGEIAEARWVSRAEYRELVDRRELRRPVRLSISSRLLEAWLGEPV